MDYKLCKQCGKINIETDSDCEGCHLDSGKDENPVGTVNKTNRKKIAFILCSIVALAAVLIGAFFLLRSNPIEEMRAQLNELDSTSYSSIANWVNDDFPYFYERLDDFELLIRSYTTDGEMVQKGSLFWESRFVGWEYQLNENRLEIDLIYLTMEEYVVKQLSEIDSNSFSEIQKWIEDNLEKEDLQIRVTSRNTDENVLYNLDVNKGEHFFVEWRFETRDFLGTIEVSLQYIFKMIRTHTLGLTFEFAGMRVTFKDDILAGRIDNYWSANDGAAYFGVPVTIENISGEPLQLSFFDLAQFNPDGIKMSWLFTPGHGDSITLIGEIQPGRTEEGILYFKYVGEGEYVVEMRSPIRRDPFEVEVIIPVYGLVFPEIEDRYNRDVPIPEVVYDLHEITLFDHTLSDGSYFEQVPYLTDRGNTLTLLQPGEIVRDPERVITHDSIRVLYNFHEADEDFNDAVSVMEQIAWNIQQGGNPSIIMGDIRATEDQGTAFLHIRRGVGLDLSTRLIVAQMLPCGEEFVVFETWLWTIRETNLVGERREAIEEFARLTGIDFIEIFLETYEGSDWDEEIRLHL